MFINQHFQGTNSAFVQCTRNGKATNRQSKLGKKYHTKGIIALKTKERAVFSFKK